MCRSVADGGRRCRIRAHLEPLPLEKVAPAPREDRPDVYWPGEPAPAELWQRYPAPVAAEAVGSLLDARDDEEQITSDVIAATAGEGRRAYGLEFRMKSPSSLARKIADRTDRSSRAAARPVAPRDVADRLTDLVRYTVVSSNHDEVVPTARSVVDSLIRRGYSVVEAEHSYIEGNPYKGLHLLVRSPAGRIVELQVHSENSQHVKDEIHVDYELERDTDRPLIERAEARLRMERRSAQVTTPDGLTRLRTLGGVRVETKRYARPALYDRILARYDEGKETTESGREA